MREIRHVRMGVFSVKMAGAAVRAVVFAASEKDYAGAACA